MNYIQIAVLGFSVATAPISSAFAAMPDGNLKPALHEALAAEAEPQKIKLPEVTEQPVRDVAPVEAAVATAAEETLADDLEACAVEAAISATAVSVLLWITGAGFVDAFLGGAATLTAAGLVGDCLAEILT